MIIPKKNEDAAWEDPIVAEVRKAREALLADAGYDLYELSRRLREAQALSDRPVVTRAPRPPQDMEAELTA